MLAEVQGNRKSKEQPLALCCGLVVRHLMTEVLPAEGPLHLSEDLVQPGTAL